MATPEYWVEADKAVKDRTHVIGYGVWHISTAEGRKCVERFSASRNGGAEVALHLANTRRDDLNSGLKE